MPKGDLTDEQWGLLEPLLPVLPRRADGRGRPWEDSCVVLNGILWILRTGAPCRIFRLAMGPIKQCTEGSSSGCARV